MSTPLQVQTSEVRDLSSKQLSAAEGYASTIGATSSASMSVLVTHGVVCSGTAMALSTVNSARVAAVTAMQSVSSDLAENLETAASQYDRVDAQGQCSIDAQMHPGGS
ncbi:ESX-1 secretion-associated protein [Mycobacterium sp. TNTM28]|uniref:ESX-1 secretion-associated protein n=1 Tax=[Mycobacterium] fortunisiensis TaxID=2600579 RepID=A0ABS6KR28_9MYCO|nr:ESX-1 secretion-associated protein [[Mycobacterium] fortunisiensis]MBU9765726.1 ESX-1 secretion-associated protein [[Mycobacterium] fortunisiensis]